MHEDQPTSTETWSVPRSSEAIAADRPSLVVRILRWIFVLGSVMLAVLGATWKKSLDLPGTGNVRREASPKGDFGLHGNGWPSRWQCADGHDHRSIPFWMALLVVAAITLVLFVRPWRGNHRR